jgi:hypothetical protein
MKKMGEPQWLFDQITKAVRSAQSLHVAFRDHRGYSWSLNLVLIKKRGE